MIGLTFIGFLVILILFLVWGSRGHLSYDRQSFVSASTQIPAPQSRYKICTYNVGYASGLDNNLRLATVQETRENLDTLKKFFIGQKADFASIQEIDLESHRSFHIDQVEYISDDLFDNVAFSANWNKNYVPYPYWPPSQHFGKVASGQATFSRYPMKLLQSYTFKRPEELPFFKRPFYLDRLAIVTEIQLGTQTLILVNVHLEAFDSKSRADQILELLELVRPYDNQPLMIAGDFNIGPTWTQDPASLDHGFDPIERSGFLTIPIEAFKGQRPLETLYTYYQKKGTDAIDHILVNSKIKIVSYTIHQEVTMASDHFPVCMEFEFK